MITVPYCGYRFRNPDRDAIYRPSGTDSFLFLMILSPMTFYFEDREPEHAEAGACIFYPPFVFHHYQAEGEFLNSFVHFRCDPPLPEPYPILTGRLFYPEQPEEIHSLLRLIQQEHLNRQDNYAQMEDLLLRQLLLLLGRVRTASHPPRERRYYGQLSALREEMLETCEKPWTLEQMCRRANIGKSQFYRYYELYFRRSPLEELTDARLQRVRYLLASSSLSVQQAAAASGFRSICHFNRFFRLRCGCTPTEFREAAFGRTAAPKPVDISAAP